MSLHWVTLVFIERNIRVRASIQTFENEHVWKGKNTCSIFFSFFLFFSFVFITNLAHNIDHSQSNPTLRLFTMHVWLNHSRMWMHVWYVWFILCSHWCSSSMLTSRNELWWWARHERTFCPLWKLRVYLCDNKNGMERSWHALNYRKLEVNVNGIRKFSMGFKELLKLEILKTIYSLSLEERC